MSFTVEFDGSFCIRWKSRCVNWPEVFLGLGCGAFGMCFTYPYFPLFKFCTWQSAPGRISSCHRSTLFCCCMSLEGVIGDHSAVTDVSPYMFYGHKPLGSHGENVFVVPVVCQAVLITTKKQQAAACQAVCIKAKQEAS